MFNITTVNCQESSKEKEQLISTYTEQLLMMEAGLRATQNFDLVEEIRTILTVKDGIVEVDGLADASLGEMARFESHRLGVVTNPKDASRLDKLAVTVSQSEVGA